MSQERVLTQILKGSASVASVALPSQEALWPNDFELYSHLQPHSFACSGRWLSGCHSEIHKTRCGPNGAGIQSKEGPPR